MSANLNVICSKWKKTKRSARKKEMKILHDELEVTVLKQGKSSKRILSISFFITKLSYKKVEEYQRELVSFLEKKKMLHGFETRIYTDNTGQAFALHACEEDPTVSVYHFNYPPLREGNGHRGTFGSFLRFRPLFEPGLEVVWISDIDVPANYMNPSILTRTRESDADFAFRTFPCEQGRSYRIYAGTMLSFRTFPMQLFTRFLHQLVTPTESLLTQFEILNKRNKVDGKPVIVKLPYGFHEVFINELLYNHLINRSVRCYILRDYEPVSTLLKRHGYLSTKIINTVIEPYHKSPSPLLFQNLKDVFHEYLPKLAEKYPCIKDMLALMPTFHTSFVKPLIKTGKELDETLYPSLEV